MGEFVRSAAFVGTLRENVSRYFGVPVEQQVSEGGMIRLQTLIELTCLNSSFSSLSSY